MSPGGRMSSTMARNWPISVPTMSVPIKAYAMPSAASTPRICTAMPCLICKTKGLRQRMPRIRKAAGSAKAAAAMRAAARPKYKSKAITVSSMPAQAGIQPPKPKRNTVITGKTNTVVENPTSRGERSAVARAMATPIKTRPRERLGISGWVKMSSFLNQGQKLSYFIGGL